jgi:hypothetical protein
MEQSSERVSTCLNAATVDISAVPAAVSGSVTACKPNQVMLMMMEDEDELQQQVPLPQQAAEVVVHCQMVISVDCELALEL